MESAAASPGGGSRLARLRHTLRTRGRRGYVIVGLLALALSAVIYVQTAGGGQPAIQYSYWGPTLPADRALVSATVAAIRTPAGFATTRKCWLPSPQAINICFRRTPSTILSDGQFAALIASTGVKPTAASCDNAWRFFHVRQPMTAVICQGAGTRGRVQLVFFITSVVRRVSQTSIAPSDQRFGPIPAGTHLDVVINGVHHANASANFAENG